MERRLSRRDPVAASIVALAVGTTVALLNWSAWRAQIFYHDVPTCVASGIAFGSAAFAGAYRHGLGRGVALRLVGLMAIAAILVGGGTRGV